MSKVREQLIEALDNANVPDYIFTKENGDVSLRLWLEVPMNGSMVSSKDLEELRILAKEAAQRLKEAND